MATNEKTIALSALARTLVRGGYIDQEDAEKLFLESQEKRKPFVNLVVEHKIVSGEMVATAAAKEFGMPILQTDPPRAIRFWLLSLPHYPAEVARLI